MEPQKFIRRPFALEAVQVTPLNYKEVAEWCGGTAIETDYKMMGGVHKMGAVLLPKQGPKNNKTHTVLIGTWITRHRGQFRWWKPEQFEAQFSPVTPEFKKNDLVRATNDTWAGWEGKVIDPMMVGVSFGKRGQFVFEPQDLVKIHEMDSLQLEFNAGVAMDPEPQTKSVLDEMREASKERLAKLEKENLAYDPSEIREGDLVKVKKHPQLTQLSPYDGQCGHVSLIELVPTADGPSKSYTVEFATAEPDNPERVPFDGGFLEKLRQDGEALNFEELRFPKGTRVEVAQPDGYFQAGRKGVSMGEYVDGKLLVMIDGKDSPWSFEEYRLRLDIEGGPYEEALKLVRDSDVVTINQFREQLGMGPIRTNANGDELLSPEALAHFRNLTPEDFAKFVEVQKVGEEDLQEALTETVGGKPLSMFDTPPLAHMTLHADGSVEQHVALDVAGVGSPNNVDYSVAMTESGELVFEVGDLVETLVEHEFDGVTIPVGTNARVCVIGVEFVGEPGTDGIEVLFADGHYNTFMPKDIKKV